MMNNHQMKMAFEETITYAVSWGMPNDCLPSSHPLSFAHIMDMRSCMDEHTFTEGKMGRWLGWAQASVCTYVIRHFGHNISSIDPLEDMKRINERHSS